MAAAMLDEALDGDVVDLGPATAVAVGIIAAALGWNVWLIRNGYAPLTALARTEVGKAVRRYFDDHCEQRLAVDLFSIGGQLVARIPHRRYLP